MMRESFMGENKVRGEAESKRDGAVVVGVKTDTGNMVSYSGRVRETTCLPESHSAILDS
jgi:hypothetical protein